MIPRFLFCSILLAASGSVAAAVYKCIQADGRIEYSSTPCGPTEEPTTFSEDATFSTLGKNTGSGDRTPRQPISDYDKRRQRAITEGQGLNH